MRDAKISASRDRVSKHPDERRALSQVYIVRNFHSRLRNTCWEARPRRCVGPRRATHPRTWAAPDIYPSTPLRLQRRIFPFIGTQGEVFPTRARCIVILYSSRDFLIHAFWPRAKNRSLRRRFPSAALSRRQVAIEPVSETRRKSIGVARAIAFRAPFCEFSRRISPTLVLN